MSTASLKPIGGAGGTYEVEFTYGDAIALPDHTDGGAVEAGYVSVSYLHGLPTSIEMTHPVQKLR